MKFFHERAKNMYAVWLLTEQRRQKEHEVHKLGVFATVAILGHKLWRNRALTGQARLWRQKLDALSEEHFPNAWQNPSCLLYTSDAADDWLVV